MHTLINRKLAYAKKRQDAISELQPLRDYFDLYKESCERYEYLKRSGVSDSVLFVEKGLMNRQLRFLLKCCEKLTN